MIVRLYESLSIESHVLAVKVVFVIVCCLPLWPRWPYL